jgi:hypothetical protein
MTETSSSDRDPVWVDVIDDKSGMVGWPDGRGTDPPRDC